MGNKGNYDKQHDSEYSFTRAAWEMFKDTEIEYHVRVVVELVPTQQRGVFYIGIQALSTVKGERERKIAAIQGSYPNGKAGTMSAYLFALSNSLAQMVGSVRADEHNAAQAR